VHKTAEGYIFKIQRYCLHDGPGIRTTIFFQGCPLRCQWCHNPESQVFIKKAGRADKGHITSISTGKIVEEIEKDSMFHDQSGGGVTFSGGEPLAQPEFLIHMLDQCRKRAVHTCVDTSGYASRGIMEKVSRKSDIILFDIKLTSNGDHIKYTGKPFKPVLENLQLLAGTNRAVKIRIPLIPGITDKKNNIDQIIALLLELKTFKEINLLPFHNTGSAKYERLGLKNQLKDLMPYPAKKTDQIKQKFTGHGFNVTIGG